MAYFLSNDLRSPSPQDDGHAISENNKPLHVIIAGWTLAGLTAAVGIRQQGHHVTMVGDAESMLEEDTFVDLTPNAHGILRRLGVFPEQLAKGSALINVGGKSIKLDATGKTESEIDITALKNLWQHPWYRVSRDDIVKLLKEQALDPALPGPSVKIRPQDSVRSVDPTKGVVTLCSGEILSGDLVVGADGVNSKVREFIDATAKPIKLNKDLVWFAADRSELGSMVGSGHFLADESFGSVSWTGDDSVVDVASSSDGRSLIISLIIDGSKGNNVLDCFQGFHSDAQKLAALVRDESLRRQQLVELAEIANWHGGQVVLIGSALRDCGMQHEYNAGLAIEDAGALAALLPSGLEKEEVPIRLALFQQFRQPRSQKAQGMIKASASWSTGQSGTGARNKLRRQLQIFLNGHDAWDATVQAERRYWLKNNRTNWLRQPVELGLQGSLRQRTNGKMHRPQHQTESTRYMIRFKTSRTVLDGFLPEGYSFESPATVAEATWVAGHSTRMDWLGGGGYHYTMLMIHGIDYAMKDGSKTHGSYLVMMIEDSIDAILGGVLDSGMTKLFASIDIRRIDDKAIVSMSWRGFQFMEMHLDGLHIPPKDKTASTSATPAAKALDSLLEDIPAPSPETGIMYERYVGAVGQPGVADAQYCCFMPFDPSRGSGVKTTVTKMEVATSARLVYHQGAELTLPTWHSLVKRFSELPFLGLVNGCAIQGTGAPDNRDVIRLE